MKRICSSLVRQKDKAWEEGDTNRLQKGFARSGSSAQSQTCEQSSFPWLEWRALGTPNPVAQDQSFPQGQSFSQVHSGFPSLCQAQPYLHRLGRWAQFRFQPWRGFRQVTELFLALPARNYKNGQLWESWDPKAYWWLSWVKTRDKQTATEGISTTKIHGATVRKAFSRWMCGCRRGYGTSFPTALLTVDFFMWLIHSWPHSTFMLLVVSALGEVF